MDRHNGSGLRHSLGDAPQREGEPTPDRVLRPHSTSLGLGSGRLVRLFLVACFLGILAGGALLLQLSAVQAAAQAPTLGHPLVLRVALHPKGDDDGNCSVLSLSCSVMPPPCSFSCSVEQPPCSFSCSVEQPVCRPVVHVVRVLIIKAVRIFDEEFKVLVPKTETMIVLVCGHSPGDPIF
jgi:hypothetical protein